jgi:hypothetical protein
MIATTNYVGLGSVHAGGTDAMWRHWHGPGFCLPLAVPVRFATVPFELEPQRADRALESQRALEAA